MTNNTHTDTQTIESSREKLTRDVAAVVAEAADLLKDGGVQGLQRAQGALLEARAAIRSGGGEIADIASVYVQKHPLKSIGVIAAAGLLLGLLIARQ
jgi:ElaB/YqjD/DUF883 family membrane-anchored ribosome-binding protein